jgi:hypothetical protein
VKRERIACTDCFADEKGNTVSPRHYGMSPERDMCQQGWNESLDKLEDCLAAT